MKTILVTGVSGFVGQHLAATLKSQGHTVVGTGTKSELSSALKHYVDTYIGDCDLTNPEAIAKLPLKTVDAIVNLAGLAQVGASFDQPELYMDVNVKVHTNIVEHLKKNRLSARVIAVSTGAVYDSNQPMPLTEDSKRVTQGSPYGLSKVAMEQAMETYQAEGMDVIIARPFNHIGPGQLDGFLVPDLAQQILTKETVTIGNLSTERDYTDVRDVVKAYALLATQPELKHNIYNVCSGHSIAGKEILQTLLTATGKQNTEIVVDQSRIRPSDPLKIVGDNSRLRNDTGWKPTIQLKQTISDYLATASKS